VVSVSCYLIDNNYNNNYNKQICIALLLGRNFTGANHSVTAFEITAMN